MADIAIAFTGTVGKFPFQIPPGAVQQVTAIPRARVCLSVVGGTITAKDAGNTTSILCTNTFPPNYAYTLEYVVVRVEVVGLLADVDNFDTLGSMAYSNALPMGGAANTELSTLGPIGILANVGGAKIYEPRTPFGGPIFNQDGNSPIITLAINDRAAANTEVGVFGSMVCALQYDIEQVFNFPINYPIPVQSRGV